jgi:hypothetical protein
MSNTPEERLAAVEFYRRQYYGNNCRLVIVAGVIEHTGVTDVSGDDT